MRRTRSTHRMRALSSRIAGATLYRGLVGGVSSRDACRRARHHVGTRLSGAVAEAIAAPIGVVTVSTSGAPGTRPTGSASLRRANGGEAGIVPREGVGAASRPGSFTVATAGGRDGCGVEAGIAGGDAAAIGDAGVRASRLGPPAKAPVDGYPGLSAVRRIATVTVGFQIRWANGFPYD